MKILILTISFLNLHPICGQSVSIEKFEQIGLSKEEVNAEAYRQLIQDFYWSTNDETAPFGNETGLETFYLFKEWRQENEQEGPLVFLSDLIAGWDLSAFDLSELDEDKIRKYLQVHSHNSRTKTLEDMPAHTQQMMIRASKEFSEEDFQQLVEDEEDNTGRDNLLRHDQAVIAVGFGQFVLEGKIDPVLAELLRIALKRQLLPTLLNRYEDSQKTERKERLTRMLKDVNKL